MNAFSTFTSRVLCSLLSMLLLSELDARLTYIETLKQGVITPLTMYRDAQERIRKRVKEDLRTSIGKYDEMRHTTLPRAKKLYEKRCEEVSQPLAKAIEFFN